MHLWKLADFRAGLPIGVAATLVVLCVGVAVAAKGRHRPIPLAGIAIAAGGLWAIAEHRHVPPAVVLGVVGIGGLGELGRHARIPRWCRLVAGVPFALAIGFGGQLSPAPWVRVLITVAVAVGATLGTEFDDTWRTEAPGLTLFVVAALGVYAAVPDTELPAALLGVSLPLVVLGWPTRLATLGGSGAASSVALLLWAGAVGGVGRPASILSAVACLGLIVAAPLAELLLPQLGVLLQRAGPEPLVLCLVVSQFVIVGAASRIAGRLSDPAEAAVVCALIGGAAVLTGALFRRPARAVAPSRVD